MNPLTAYEIVDQATSQAPLNRIQHEQVLGALSVLKQVIDEKTAADEAAAAPKEEPVKKG